MIKFFRKFRLKMLNENKFSKYLIYAIGEILLVVIGILIALQINIRNESNKLIAAKHVYYQQLLKDLASDSTYLEGKIVSYENRISNYNKYKERYKSQKLSPEEVIQFQSQLNFMTDHIRFQNSTIESLENTGDIKLIPLELRNKIIDLKRHQELIIEFTNNNYAYYMQAIKPTGLSGSIPGFEERLNHQPELKSYLNIEEKLDVIILSIEYAMFLKIYNEGTNINEFKKMLTDIETIVELINSDLKD